MDSGNDSFDMNEEIEDENNCATKESKKRGEVCSKPREKNSHNSEVCEIDNFNIVSQNTTKSTIKVEHESEIYQRSPSSHCVDFGVEFITRNKKRATSGRQIEQFLGFSEESSSPKENSSSSEGDDGERGVSTSPNTAINTTPKTKTFLKKQRKSAGTPIQMPLPASAIPSPIHPVQVVSPSTSTIVEPEGEEENPLKGGKCVEYRGRKFKQYSVVLALETRNNYRSSYHFVTIQDFRPDNKVNIHWEGYNENEDISIDNLIEVEEMVRFRNRIPKVGDIVYTKYSSQENEPEGFWPVKITKLELEVKRAKIKLFNTTMSKPIELLYTTKLNM